MIFYLLGPVLAGDANLITNSALVRTLLVAFLITDGKPVSRNGLISLIWQDPPASAADNIRLHVRHLRKALASTNLAERLTTIRGGGGEGGGSAYRLLIEPGDLDLHIFHERVAQSQNLMDKGEITQAAVQLERALQLWRGPAGADSRGSQRLALRLDALNEQRLLAWEDLLELRLHLVPPSRVTPDLYTLIAESPLRERSHSLLMRALYLSGDTVGALAAYENARNLLAEELGIDPGPELRRIHQAVIDHNESIIWDFNCRLLTKYCDSPALHAAPGR